MRIDPKNLSLGWVLGLVTVLAAFGVGFVLGLEPAVLTLAGGVLVLVIFVLWNSVLNLTGDSSLSLEEAMSLAAPTPEEEQKRAVLRTLKDLDYERSVGKISESDYQELSHSYRERAKALIRAADEGMASGRDKAERLFEKKLREANKNKKNKKLSAQAKPSPEARAPLPGSPDEDDRSEREEDVSKPKASRRVCAECDTKNEADAKFCKKCGVELEVDA